MKTTQKSKTQQAEILREYGPYPGAVLERFEMPRSTGVSGLEADGAGVFYCGGGASGKVRAVRKPKR